MQTIRPAKHQLFCKPEEVTEMKTNSGLFIPKETQEAPKVAEVINTGSDVSQFKQGDKIVYKDYSTTEVKLDGKEFFLVAEEDVLGVVVEVE